MYQQLIDEFIRQQRLPQTYADDANRNFLPLLRDIENQIASRGGQGFVLGINGAQGTGKSTLALLLSTLLESDGHRVANLSIDDFYYSKARREALAQSVHPLLASRGVPGTHDIESALALLPRLFDTESDEPITLPGFDKASDDCIPLARCRQIRGPVDVVIVEGWFVGAEPQQESALLEPINRLEEQEDGDGRWRRYVNQQLSADYQTLFARLDSLVLLAAPGFDQVLEWRSLQEEKLRQRSQPDASGLMSVAEIARFIQHFERLTRHCLSTLPAKADRVFLLDSAHRVSAA